MAIKKFTFLAVVFCLLASYGYTQTTGTGYDVADSSVVSSRRMPQHTEFMNGTYNFPAKPRNMLEIGVKVGAFTISGDVPAKFPTLGGGVHIRKALGYLFSMRLNYMYGIGKGQAWLRSQGYRNNPAWAGNGYNAATEPVFYNYRTKVQDIALEGIFTLNNIRFHRAKSGFNVYALAGIGATTYEVEINALNGNAKYNFGSVAAGTWETRKDTRDALENLMDDTYETPAENHGTRRPKLFGNTFKPVGHIGGGVAFKLSNRINLAIENRFTIVKDDLLDGQRWTEQDNLRPELTRDYDAYNYATVGLNFNLGSKSTEPLWWLNPLDYAYQEIRKPRLMILPKPVLPDADGDGVTDQFDQEQTPQGCPVDTHGVSRDTDGDGVPDCRDKELITPTTCQPVDADGVGKCPVACPDSTCPGWGAGRGGGGVCDVALGQLPSVTFAGNGTTISNDAKAMLAQVATAMRNNPECRVVVVGYCASSKPEQTRSWNRVNAVINYMVETEGISQDRFVFFYGQTGGDCNTVDFRAAMEGEQSMERSGK